MGRWPHVRLRGKSWSAFKLRAAFENALDLQMGSDCQSNHGWLRSYAIFRSVNMLVSQQVPWIRSLQGCCRHGRTAHAERKAQQGVAHGGDTEVAYTRLPRCRMREVRQRASGLPREVLER